MFWVDSSNSIVQLDFDYCSVVWGKCGFGLCEKIQKLQDHAARIILYASNEDDIDELFQALSGRKLSHQRLIATSVMMLSTLYGLIPEYLQSPFIFRNDITSHRLTMLIINYWLFHNPAPTIWRKPFPAGVLCSRTAFPMNFEQQFLYANLKLKCVIIALNETWHPRNAALVI